MNQLFLGDCTEVIKQIPDSSVDLIITDPPYLIENTNAGGKSRLAKSIQSMNDELHENELTTSINTEILDEMLRVMKKVNLYIWCNHKQIPMYLKFFVEQHGCSFDILVWNKTNATPLFNNKYLTDKEYCLYFRRGGYCNPIDYEHAKTVWYHPINAKDKKIYGHPTIKPLGIIDTLVMNSSKEGDTVLDMYMGSGTTGVACYQNNRNFIGIEINEKYFNIAKERIENAENQLGMDWRLP